MGESRSGLCILRERYEPNPEPAPTELGSRPLRVLAERRWEAGATLEDSPAVSFILAATAAAALAAVVVTLFRRVTRWLELTAPREME